MAEPQPKPGGLWSSWTSFAAGTAALLTAAGGLLGGLAAAGVIGGSGHTVQQAAAPATTSATTTSSETLVTFSPTPDENRLLRVVPADLQPTCKRPGETDKTFPAQVSLFCYDSALKRPGYVRFVIFGSLAELNQYMSGRLGLGNAKRRCGTGPSGSGVYDDSAGQPMGQLVCYLDNNGAWIEWTNTPALVYGVANEPNGDWSTLYEFWARVSQTGS